jgi:hypothetical protein
VKGKEAPYLCKKRERERQRQRDTKADRPKDEERKPKYLTEHM